jgi:multimeric flavodoxin WrbA
MNTLKLVGIVEEELRRLGPVEVEHVQLSEKRIEPCRGCILCMAKGFAQCPIDDDLRGIMDSIEGSDGVILASPVYIYHVTAQMKQFLDRLASFCHRPAFFGKHAMALSTTGAFGTGTTLGYLRDVLGVLGFRTVVTAGGRGVDREGRFPPTLERKARKAARRFHASLSKGGAMEPSLASVIQFRVQRMIFTSPGAARIFPADFEHYAALGGRVYPVDAPVNPFKRALAWLVEGIAKLFAKSMF